MKERGEGSRRRSFDLRDQFGIRRMMLRRRREMYMARWEIQDEGVDVMKDV
jgi:hypothetical protein